MGTKVPQKPQVDYPKGQLIESFRYRLVSPYVTRKYIVTYGCSTKSVALSPAIKSPVGKGRCYNRKTYCCNIRKEEAAFLLDLRSRGILPQIKEMKAKYYAADGTEFNSKSKCLSYNLKIGEKRMMTYYYASDGTAFKSKSKCLSYETDILIPEKEYERKMNLQQKAQWKREGRKWLNIIEKMTGKKPRLIYNYSFELCDLEDIYVKDKNPTICLRNENNDNVKLLYKLRLCFQSEWEKEPIDSWKYDYDVIDFGKGTVLFGLSVVGTADRNYEVPVSSYYLFSSAKPGAKTLYQPGNGYIRPGYERSAYENDDYHRVFYDENSTYGTISGKIYSAKYCIGMAKDKSSFKECRRYKLSDDKYELTPKEELVIENLYENDSIPEDEFVENFLKKYEFVNLSDKDFQYKDYKHVILNV